MLKLIIVMWALATSAYAVEVYVGCGSVTEEVTCVGCSNPGTGCHCYGPSQKCVQGTIECLKLPAGFTEAPSGYSIYRVDGYCKKRRRCNNASTVDLGDCPPPTTCDEGEAVYESPREFYYPTFPC